MVHLNDEITDFKTTKNLLHDGEDLSIWDHEGIVSSNVEIALIELSKATLVHLRLITPVDFGDVEAFDLLKALRSHVSSEGHSKIVAESKQLATLVLQVVDQLRVLSVLSSEGLLELEDRSVDLTCSMFVEDALDLVKCFLPNRHLQRGHITSALRTLGQSTFLVANLKDLSKLTLQLSVEDDVEVVGLIGEESARLAREVVEEATTALAKLDTSRGCCSRVFLGFFLVVSSFTDTLFLNPCILSFSHSDDFSELALESILRFLSTQVSNRFPEGRKICLFALSLFVPVLVQELTAHIAELNGRFQVTKDCVEEHFDLVDEGVLRARGNVLQLPILLLVEKGGVVRIQVLCQLLAEKLRALVQQAVGQVARRQRHVVFDGTVDIVAICEHFGPIHHRLHVGSELIHSLCALAQSQSKVGEVVDVGLEQFAAQGQNCVVASQILLKLVQLEAGHGLQHMGWGLQHEVLFLRKFDAACAN